MKYDIKQKCVFCLMKNELPRTYGVSQTNDTINLAIFMAFLTFRIETVSINSSSDLGA